MNQLDPYITDVLMRDLVGHDRRPVSFLVYLWLSTHGLATHGLATQKTTAGEQESRKPELQISYQELAENIGVSKSSAQAAVSWLVRRKLLAVSKENVTATPRYSVLSPWRERNRRRAG
jgi:hypothetical protein